MISEMSLMRALVIKSESDKIFDALSKTGATQIKKCGEYELASPAEAKSLHYRYVALNAFALKLSFSAFFVKNASAL